MKSSRIFVMHILMNFMPPTRCFRLKRILLRWAGAQVGKNVIIVSSARFYLSGRFVIGDGTWIGHEVLIAGGDADVFIGSNVDIAPRVTLVTGSHELFTPEGRVAGKGYSLPIIIEDGSWLGVSSTILGGKTVARCGMVGAGALVTRNVKSGSIVGGVPAREIPRIIQNNG